MRIIKIFMWGLGIISLGIILYFIFDSRKALSLIFPDFSDVSYITSDIRNDSAHTILYVVVQNKNIYKSTIDTIYIEAELNNIKIVQQKIPMHLNISKRGSDTIALPLDIPVKKTQQVIKDLKGQDSTGLAVKCYIVYTTFFGSSKIHFQKQVKIRTPIPPEIKVISVKQKKYDLREKTLSATVTVQIINRGKYIDIQLDSIYYQITLKKTLHTQGFIARAITVKPMASTTFDIPVTVILEHPLRTAFRIALDRDVIDYECKIKCKAWENHLKKHTATPIEINTSGTVELID